jgi:dihydrofolate synthase/folylpolyglutamate synthase
MAALQLAALGIDVREEHIRSGLAAARIPARLSVHGTRPLVLVDGAHSPASLTALGATLLDHAPPGRRIAVFGMAADKDLVGSVAALARFCDVVIATHSGQPRAAAPERLEHLLHAAGVPAETAPDVVQAVRRARALAGPDDTLIVTGSLYLCGAFLASSSAL